MSRRLASIAALMLCACSGPSQPIELGRFTTDLPEFGLTWGPDGYYLTRQTGPFGSDAPSSIWRYPKGGGAPTLASFSDTAADERDFSWDPRSQQGCFVRNLDIWCTQWRNATGWSAPVRLPSPINTTGYEASPHWAPDGTLFFSSMREGGLGQGDIYRAVRTAEGWSVEALGDAINSEHGEWNLALSPDGTVMVFEASGRPTNRTVPGDLYLSCFRHGEWAAARPMDALNTDGSDLDFRFSGQREGYFTTATDGDADLRYADPENFALCD